MGASSEHLKSGGSSGNQSTKLEAKTRRKHPAATRPKPKGGGGPRKKVSRGTNQGPWVPLALVALFSAGVGFWLNDPARVQQLFSDVSKRVNAAGAALTLREDKPKVATPKNLDAKPAKTASLTPPHALKALSAVPPVAKPVPTSSAATAKAGTKPAAPTPSWTAAEEKDLYNALGRKDQDAFRKLVAHHHEVLPIETALDQDILTAAIARGKLADAQFMLASGLSADRLVTTPVKPAFQALIENSAFAEAAKGDKNVTLLMVAAAAGDSRMVTFLQSQGAKNRSTTPNKYTALDFAVGSGKAEAIQACLGRKPGDESTRILVSLKERTATFFQEGRIQQRSWVSTGRDGHPTPTGRFVVTQKHKDWTSTKYHVKMPYFLRLNNGAIGLHAGNVPPYPASHGCIRLPDEEARSFFQMADIGTIVDIVN